MPLRPIYRLREDSLVPTGTITCPVRNARDAFGCGRHARIGRPRQKRVQLSSDALARAANGQSERPVERGIGCHSDVPHARVEDRARGAVARSHWRPGARGARTPEAGPAAACAWPRLAVGPVTA